MLYRVGLGTLLPAASPFSLTDWFASLTLPVAKLVGNINQSVTNTLHPYEGSGSESLLDVYSQGMYHYIPSSDAIHTGQPAAPQTNTEMTDSSMWTPEQAKWINAFIDTNPTDAPNNSNLWFFGIIVGGILIISKIVK